MNKQFNITGSCNPEKHYMVNLDSRLTQIKAMIDDGQYFTINRGRQYGKTTKNGVNAISAKNSTNTKRTVK